MTTHFFLYSFLLGRGDYPCGQRASVWSPFPSPLLVLLKWVGTLKPHFLKLPRAVRPAVREPGLVMGIELEQGNLSSLLNETNRCVLSGARECESDNKMGCGLWKHRWETSSMLGTQTQLAKSPSRLRKCGQSSSFLCALVPLFLPRQVSFHICHFSTCPSIQCA